MENTSENDCKNDRVPYLCESCLWLNEETKCCEYLREKPSMINQPSFNMCIGYELSCA